MNQTERHRVPAARTIEQPNTDANSPSAVAQLLASARVALRPAWSQAFLADELSRAGFPTSRDQIARLERSAPCGYRVTLVIAAAHVMGLGPTAVEQAILEDLDRVRRETLPSLHAPDG